MENLKADKRFKLDLYKTTKPHNALTLLDPRFSDLYFNEEQKDEAINVIYNDVVFRDERDGEDQNMDIEVDDNVNVTAAPEEHSNNLNPIEKRRLELLAKKASSQVSEVRRLNLKEKIKEEVETICAASSHISSDTDPMKWFKENQKSVPNVAKFWLAHCSFPATSCSAERVFNVDALIITDIR